MELDLTVVLEVATGAPLVMVELELEVRVELLEQAA